MVLSNLPRLLLGVRGLVSTEAEAGDLCDGGVEFSGKAVVEDRTRRERGYTK